MREREKVPEEATNAERFGGSKGPLSSWSDQWEWKDFLFFNYYYFFLEKSNYLAKKWKTLLVEFVWAYNLHNTVSVWLSTMPKLAN